MEASNQTSKVYNGDAVHYSFGVGEVAGMVQLYYVPTMGHIWASGSNGEVLKATDVLMDFSSQWTVERRASSATTLPDMTSGSGRCLPDTWSLVRFSMVALAFIRVFRATKPLIYANTAKAKDFLAAVFPTVQYLVCNSEAKHGLIIHVFPDMNGDGISRTSPGLARGLSACIEASSERTHAGLAGDWSYGKAKLLTDNDREANVCG
jgi:hypothetical protein